MPRKSCYWTRKLELELVEFIREREFVWKPCGNTNHIIQQKYKAFAEFAAKLGRGFTARSVRDRWVNIRSTFNHNLRRLDKTKSTALTASQVYVPCWPLWKPLQFLREVSKKDDENIGGYTAQVDYDINQIVKEESQSDFDDNGVLRIRQRGQITDRPRHKSDVQMTLKLSNQRTDRPRRRNLLSSKEQNEKCTKILDNLIISMRPLVMEVERNGPYTHFGKHVAERLSCMREIDAECASRDIMELLNNWQSNT